eukprot:800210-Rhodomonas_salina.1
MLHTTVAQLDGDADLLEKGVFRLGVRILEPASASRISTLSVTCRALSHVSGNMRHVTHGSLSLDNTDRRLPGWFWNTTCCSQRGCARRAARGSAPPPGECGA